MSVRIGKMRASGLIAGLIVLVLGALTMADAVVSIVTNNSFMFAENMNRNFEFVVGFVTIVLGAAVMDLSRT